MVNEDFSKLRELISNQRRIIKELISSKNYYNEGNASEKKMISQQIVILTGKFKKNNKEINEFLEGINLSKPLPEQNYYEDSEKEENIQKAPEKKKLRQYEIPEKIVLTEKYSWKQMKPDGLERETFKRIEKQKDIKTIKTEMEFHEANGFVRLANKLFQNFSKKVLDEQSMKTLEKDLTKANMQFTGQEYFSLILLSSIVAIFAAGILMVFFLFFNIGPDWPIITRATDELGARLLKVFWMIFVIPLGTFVLMFLYPSMEKSSAGNKMDQEMPFATMHMSAIAGSMINPTNIFEIIIATKEYPNLSKQFIKLINETSIYGYDIVSALRISSENCPSKKLSELYNGLATTINSGGDLPEFFEKRSESLLFEYNLEKEKRTKSAETFMDIYISVVIAAPMILMILLMMIKISGLGGISLSTQAITLIMIISVTAINIVFISFLEVKK